MKALKNIKMRAKLFILTIPMMVALIASVVIAGVKIYKTEKDVTGVYYDALYTINNKLINADRDFYQAMMEAAKYREFTEGYTDFTAEIAEATLKSYEDNRQQVFDRVTVAVDVASKYDSLYLETKAEDGTNFKQAADDFWKEFDKWENAYNIKGTSGNWVEFNQYFEVAREYIDTMQEITEAWAVKEHDELTYTNQMAVLSFAILYGLIIFALLIFVTLILHQISSSIRDVTSSLNALAAGDLKHRFPTEDEMGRDELGSIHLCAKRLSEKLSSIIGDTKQMSEELTQAGKELSASADQVSQSSQQVSIAVSEISQGATSQASSVEVAANNTSDIGEDINRIHMVVEVLSKKTNEMKVTCDDTVGTMKGLLSQNEEVVRSMQQIQEQISATNQAVNEIAEASRIITDISAQTNLLSLNASIEAARAGEAGRGFAVVATEIGNLADQSGNAAVKISEIVKNLVTESAKSVTNIQQLNEGFKKQNSQIHSTGEEIHSMSEEVDMVVAEMNEISGKIANLNTAKESLVNIVSDLSALSEENAASSEETNASMEELNDTFELINESAVRLERLAESLKESISYFKN